MTMENIDSGQDQDQAVNKDELIDLVKDTTKKVTDKIAEKEEEVWKEGTVKKVLTETEVTAETEIIEKEVAAEIEIMEKETTAEKDTEEEKSNRMRVLTSFIRKQVMKQELKLKKTLIG